MFSISGAYRQIWGRPAESCDTARACGEIKAGTWPLCTPSIPRRRAASYQLPLTIHNSAASRVPKRPVHHPLGDRARVHHIRESTTHPSGLRNPRAFAVPNPKKSLTRNGNKASSLQPLRAPSPPVVTAKPYGSERSRMHENSRNSKLADFA
jgi:hypothetical protein